MDCVFCAIVERKRPAEIVHEVNFVLARNPRSSAQSASSAFPNYFTPHEPMPTKIATFALGCFWGAEETFRTTPGITSTAVGYMDRAEVVQVTYDPAQISYENLLTIFWDNHNPTAADPGGLERSEVFCHDDDQRVIALASKRALDASGKYRKPIATPISSAGVFTCAPEDQQQYYLKQGISSCEVNH